MEGDITKYFKQYRIVEAKNDSALKHLARLRKLFERKDIVRTMREYNRLTRAVALMAESYFPLSPNQEVHKSFYPALDRVESRGGNALENALGQIVVGKTPDFNLQVIDGLYYGDRDGNEGFNDCRTMHDFIRCLHGAALARILENAEDLPGTEKRQFDDGSTLTLAREDDQKNGDLVDGVCAIYKEGVGKKGSENNVIVLMDKGMYVRCSLGCHLSYLDVSLSEGYGDITARFANTSKNAYRNAINREAYVKGVMTHLGFEGLHTVGDITTGRKTDIKREDLKASIREIMRLFVSTKDLDVDSSDIAGRVDEAVGAFINGETNIFNYLIKPK
jgi:hypothetical protein